MRERLGYKIDSEIKKEYDRFIQEEYGHKRNVSGSEIGKWMKLGLAIHGHEKYQDDPDVKEMLEFIRRSSPCAHTQPKEDIHNCTNDFEERFNKIEKTLKKLTKQQEENASIKDNKDMDMFAQLFQEQYGEYKQVSYTDISKLVMRTHGVVDKRSIHNRVQYLLAEGCIEPYAPNVYNIK